MPKERYFKERRGPSEGKNPFQMRKERRTVAETPQMPESGRPRGEAVSSCGETRAGGGSFFVKGRYRETLGAVYGATTLNAKIRRVSRAEGGGNGIVG